MILFHTKAGLVTLTELEVTADSLPSAGDRRFSLEIALGRFNLTGHTFWVAQDDWQRFTRSAVKVLQRREGTAAFRSMSPDSCQLVIKPSRNKRDLKLSVNIISFPAVGP